METKVVDINTSNVGNAKNLVVEIDENGCWNVISHRLDSGGYGQYRGKRTHVFMYEKEKGNIPKGMVVRHICDNTKCCNPQHLILGTQYENVMDRENRNRCDRSKKLNEQMVKEIAEMCKPESEIAKIYGIRRQTVNDIKNNRIWKKVDKNIVKYREIKNGN